MREKDVIEMWRESERETFRGREVRLTQWDQSKRKIGTTTLFIDINSHFINIPS